MLAAVSTCRTPGEAYRIMVADSWEGHEVSSARNRSPRLVLCKCGSDHVKSGKRVSFVDIFQVAATSPGELWLLDNFRTQGSQESVPGRVHALRGAPWCRPG